VEEVRIAFGLTMETSLSELTADYLKLLFGGTVTTTAQGASQKGYEELDINPGATTDKYAFGFEGKRVVGSNVFPIRFFVSNGTFKLNGAIEFNQKTGDPSMVPIMVKALKPSSGAPTKMQRITAAATA
ncbi:MAG: hypothetical protein AAF485_32545, partial [Chloroflexota bacterium]